MKPFDTIAVAKSYSLTRADGPISFLALEHGKAKRFSQYVEYGCWRIREVK